MLQQVETIAAQRQARGVTSITIRIGPLSGVEPDLLQHAFPMARAGTVAAEARLIVERLPIRVRCEQCDAETEATPNRLLCGACGDWHTRLVSGDEMLLASVELLL
jgi:hydrogenase nickel incorporation protein HypA/HybF